MEGRVGGVCWVGVASRNPLEVKQHHQGATGVDELRIAIPAAAPDAIDSVIVLETDGAVKVITTLMQQPDRRVTLPAYLSDIHAAAKPKLRFDSRGVVEQWLDKSEWLSWDFQVSSPGEFEVVAITSGQKYGSNWEGGHR